MGLLSQLLWQWRPDAARPEHRGRVIGIQCLRTASGWTAGPFVSCAEGRPRAKRRWVTPSRVGSLPSSEAEMRGAVEGSRREPSSEAETAPRSEVSVDGPHRVGGPRVWASLSPFLSSRSEGGRGPSWAQSL